MVGQPPLVPSAPAASVPATVLAPGKSDYTQQSSIFEQIASRVTFENDGTGTREVSGRVRIQSEAGLKDFSILPVPYQSFSEDLSVDFMRVRKPDGSIIVTPAENVQDMPSAVAREAPMYTDSREKQIAVKGLDVGDVVEYRFRWKIKKPLAPGQFWFSYDFPRGIIRLEEVVQISIPRDRMVKWKSPDLKPTISDEGSRRIFTWKTSNLEVKPQNSTKLSPEQRTQFAQAVSGTLPPPDLLFSSFQTWEEVGRWYDDLQRERLQPSTEIRAKAAELTKGVSDDPAKLRAIYNYVSTKIHYIGISFGVGRYQPHPATTVLDNQYGDCKDKHTLMASLLNATGAVAYPALMNSSRRIDLDVPTPAQFDHVISAVPRGQGYIWLDSTEEVAPFEFLASPLRNKPALVVAGDKAPVFVTTAAELPFPERQVFKIDAKIDEQSVLVGKVTYTFRGNAEYLLRAAFRKTARAQWTELVQRISYGSGFGGEVSDVNASAPEATEQPFQLEYTYHRKDYPDLPNHQISVPMPLVPLPQWPEEEGVPFVPLFLGPDPGIFEIEGRVELPNGYTPQLPKAIDLVKDFGEYHAAYTFERGALVGKRKLIVKQRQVEQAQAADYKLFHTAYDEDYSRLVPLTLPGEKAMASDLTSVMARLWKQAWQLPDSKNAEAQRLEQRGRADDSVLVDSLQRAVALDPRFTRAWLELAAGYARVGDRARGLEAIKSAATNTPREPVALKFLAVAQTFEGRWDQALLAWKDVLELAPDDSDTPIQLGSVLTRLKRYPEAIAHYEAAVRAWPGDAALQEALGMAYFRAGQKEKAIEVFKRCLDLSSDPAEKNTVAYEFADANVELPRALQLAQDAVRSQEEATGHIVFTSVTREDLTGMTSLANDWDTLGWVQFRMANYASAEKYLAAAFQLSQNPVIADHLAQTYQAQHKLSDAIRFYEMALAAPGLREQGVDATAIRERLQHLSPVLSRAQAGVRSMGGGDNLSRLRTTKLPRLVTDTENADFLLLFRSGSTTGKPLEATFVSGSEKLKTAAKTLLDTDFKILFPDSAPLSIVRRGMLACSSSDCSFVLYSAETVYSVN